MAAPKARNPLAALDSDQEYTQAVRDVPEAIKSWVERAYDAWLKNRNGWREITFADAEEMSSIMDDARHYTNNLRATPLSVITQGKPETTADGLRVVYRVRDKVHSGRRPRGATSAE